MNEWLSTILIVGSLVSATLAFIWIAVKLGREPDTKDDQKKSYTSAADIQVEHIFNDEFREELRNRGRLHFEKIIGENAMFLQQDLRLTTSQINEYMKQEIKKTLHEAFTKYEESIQDAKEIALDSIQKTKVAVEEQRKVMEDQLNQVMEQEKKRLIARFENNMADIVNHYVLSAIGNQISLDDQLEYILAELERNKKDIILDIESGA
jgi:flagellar biosynthesis/type III secretory pathway protein FliH